MIQTILTWVTVLLVCILFGKFFFSLIIKLGKAEIAEKRENEQLTLQLHPAYRQRLAEDRAYELASRRLAIQESETHHKHHLERTRVTPETYLIDHEPVSIIQLPSLKRVQPEERTTVTAEDESPDIPPSCRFSDVLRSFTPSMEQIFLAYQTGYKMVTSRATDLCHVANVATTGAGKSTNIRILVGQLCYVRARVVVLNPHYTSYDIETHEDWTPIENKLFKPPVTEYRAIAQWLKWAAEVELRRRIGCYNRSQRWGAPLFLVVEELPSITNHIPEAMGWIAELLREGRKVNMLVITAAQDMLVKTLNLEGGAIRDCFRTAFYMGGDTTTARKLLDLQGAIDESGLGKGVALLRSSELPKGTRVRVPYADNEALYHLLGPSTFDFSKVVDADPDIEPVIDGLPLNTNNVTAFPVVKEERKEVTLQEAIEAWNEGFNTVRTMAAHLGITRYQAEQFCKQIAGMRREVSD